jgi:hypothetical protein
MDKEIMIVPSWLLSSTVHPGSGKKRWSFGLAASTSKIMLIYYRDHGRSNTLETCEASGRQLGGFVSEVMVLGCSLQMSGVALEEMWT